ncbi:TPA: ECF transporter S component [Candidatus Bathyarchaeota archaeon]|nr:ECF transporter S component [Candidatus Bathyarchaeota archaeon]
MNVGGKAMHFSVKELAVIVLMAALGAVVSVPLGYLGKALNAVAILPFGAPQLLAGVHVLWLLIAALYTRRVGSAAATSIIKGLVEVTLFSAQGVTAIPISIAEGLLCEAGLLTLGRNRWWAVAVSGGLSSVGNVVVLRLLVLFALPVEVIAFMAVMAFISGAVVGLFSLRVNALIRKIGH